VKTVVGKKIPRWQHRAGSTPAPGTMLAVTGENFSGRGEQISANFMPLRLRLLGFQLHA